MIQQPGILSSVRGLKASAGRSGIVIQKFALTIHVRKLLSLGPTSAAKKLFIQLFFRIPTANVATIEILSVRYMASQQSLSRQSSTSCFFSLSPRTTTPSSVQALLNSLDLQRQELRVDPTQRQVPAHEPQSRMATGAPHLSSTQISKNSLKHYVPKGMTYRINLTLPIQIPHVLTPIRLLLAERLRHARPHIIVAGRQHDDISLQPPSISEDQRVLLKALDTIRAVGNLNLAIADELRAADINIVPTTTGDVLPEKPTTIWAPVQHEAIPRKPLNRLALELLPHHRRERDVQRELHGGGQALREDVCVLGGRAELVVQALVHGEDAFPLGGRDDVGAAALDHRHAGGAGLVVVLGDVVAAVARADDDDLFGGEVGAAGCRVGVLAAVVDGAGEVGLAGEGGDFGFAGVAGAEDDVVRVEGAGLAGVAAVDGDGPGVGGVRVGAGGDGGGEPDVELEERGVGFEPVAELVLGREERPRARERHVCHVGVVDGVMGDESLRRMSGVG